MSSYEFWDELGKIFNAVVAYQEKNLEFNKRFISPWIRLGNVFEKQDRNQEAMHAYQRAIEIDGANPQNWYELGNIHFKMENYGEAVAAFQKAIELDPGFGWALNNLALTLATMGESEQAVELYQKAIELLQDVKDKAVAWNRLGNAYRKLNQYEQALEAFHRADELDGENSGFRDSMDEVTDGPSLIDEQAEVKVEDVSEPTNTNPVAPSIEMSPADKEVAPTVQAAAPAAVPQAEEAMQEIVPADVPVALDGTPPAEVEPQVAVSDVPVEAVEAVDDPTPLVTVGAELPAADSEAKDAVDTEETVTAVVQNSAQTFTETLPLEALTSETSDSGQPPEADADGPAVAAAETSDVVTSEEPQAVAPQTSDSPVVVESGLMNSEDSQPAAPKQADDVTATDPTEVLDPAPNSLADQLLEAEPQLLDVAQQVAYEAFLKDTSEPLRSMGTDEEDEVPVELPGSPEPMSKIDESGELQIEMDTKNAHVWNELGNVYFNTSAFDDAIVAYSKAIELDRWFAWPYSNLALAYVQKRRFVEAILLYQRSIELFGAEKDKAISWNRLGNVYRRLNDYENAIAAYQRADALDPDNSTLSLQSRFSLLGNYAMEQKPSYVS